MSLIQHAKRELELAGLFDKDSDYNGMLGNAVMKLVEVFSKQGHSGFSAHQTLYLFNEVAKYQNLTPITSNPEDWQNISYLGEEPMWQCKRNPEIFSKDEGKTWYSVSDKET